MQIIRIYLCILSKLCNYGETAVLFWLTSTQPGLTCSLPLNMVQLVKVFLRSHTAFLYNCYPII